MSRKIVINKQRINKQVYDCLKDMIIYDELKPGEKLSIERIAQELNVSRTPVNIALTNLQRDGYVTIRPQSGTFVRELDGDELMIIYKTRALLEKLLVETYGAKIPINQIAELRKQWEGYYGKTSYGQDDLNKLFELDLRLHGILVGAARDIIRGEVLNIADLTKRSRILLLKNMVENPNTARFRDINIKFHIDIVDAIVAGNYTDAAELVYQDIMHTWEGVKSLY